MTPIFGFENSIIFKKKSKNIKKVIKKWYKNAIFFLNIHRYLFEVLTAKEKVYIGK